MIAKALCIAVGGMVVFSAGCITAYIIKEEIDKRWY